MAGEKFDRIYTKNTESPEAKEALLKKIEEEGHDTPRVKNKASTDMYERLVSEIENENNKLREILDSEVAISEENRDSGSEDHIRWAETAIQDNVAEIEEYRKKLGELTELEKGESEKLAIEESIRAVNEAIKGLGLPIQEIPPDNIHIFSEEGFRAVSREGAAAFYSKRHIYMPRTSNITNMIFILTHEMLHLVSASVGASRDGSADNLYERQTGVDFVSGKGRSLFSGFNEALIESMAIKARGKIDVSKLNLTSLQVEELLGRVAYYRHVSLFHSISFRYLAMTNDNFRRELKVYVAAKKKFEMDGEDPEGFKKLKAEFEFAEQHLLAEVKDKIFSACIKGDYSIFKELEIIQPRSKDEKGQSKTGFTEIIANMGTYPEDAKEAAEQLEFTYLTKLRVKTSLL